jgi:hypothetical protein
MVKIEFDVAWDETKETFHDVVSRSGAEYAVLTESGPGGGWPVVEFVVAEERLDDLIKTLGYGDELEFWRDQARPA